jgi:hypothetical protein
VIQNKTRTALLNSAVIKAVVPLLFYLTSATAGQLTLGDWDFDGVDCFPTESNTYDLGWTFEVEAGAGIEIVSIDIWDWGQYDVIYSGGGILTCILNNCELQGGNEGAQFDCDMPNDMFNHYLPEVIVEMPATFCSFCDGWEPQYGFSIEEVYPNPASAEAQVVIEIDEQGYTRLELHSLAANPVMTLLNEIMESGEHQVSLIADGTLPLGWYNLLLMTTADTISTGFCLLNHPQQVSDYPPLLTTDVDGRFFIPIDQLPLGLSCTNRDENGNLAGTVNSSVALVLHLDGYDDVACNFQLDDLSVERPVFVMTSQE